MAALQKKEENMMKTYLKNEKGITMTILIVTILVVLILAGVGIAAFAPGGLIEKAENLKSDIPLKQVIEEVHNNLDYKYYATFNEELGTNGSEELVEQIVELSIKLNLPLDVFTINYEIDYGAGEVNKSTKKIYYRYDKIVSVKEEDNYEYANVLDEEEILELIGPNNKELEIINKLEEEGIEQLKGDVNLDGFLSSDDMDRFYEFDEWIGCNGFFGFTNVELMVGDLDEDGWLNSAWDGGMILEKIILKIEEIKGEIKQ